jgi:hypothetical protein
MFFPDARGFPDFAGPAAGKYLPLFVVIVGAASALAMLSTAQAGAALAYAGHSIPWKGLMRARLVDWYAYAIFMPGLYWLAGRYPIDRASWHRPLACYLLLGPPVALAKEVIYVSIGNFCRPGMFSLPNILAEDFSSEVLTAWALICLAHILAFRDRAGERKGREAKADPVDRISVRDRDVFRLIRTADIEWVDSQGNYGRLTTAAGRYLVRETLSSLEARLGPRFLRVHRRIIVNVDKVERVERRSHSEYRLFLSSGECVTSSRSYNQGIRRLVQAGWRGEAAAAPGH